MSLSALMGAGCVPWPKKSSGRWAGLSPSWSLPHRHRPPPRTDAAGHRRHGRRTPVYTAAARGTPSRRDSTAVNTLTVELGSRSYPILIGAGLLSRPDLLQQHVPGQDILLVS